MKKYMTICVYLIQTEAKRQRIDISFLPTVLGNIFSLFIARAFEQEPPRREWQRWTRLTAPKEKKLLKPTIEILKNVWSVADGL